MNLRYLLITSSILFSSLAIANPDQHLAESGMPYLNSKNLITIQPHTRSAAVNAKHAADCAAMGGLDITDQQIIKLGKNTTDAVVCEITDNVKFEKYRIFKPKLANKSVQSIATTEAPTGYYYTEPFYPLAAADVYRGAPPFDDYTPYLGFDIGGIIAGKVTGSDCAAYASGPKINSGRISNRFAIKGTCPTAMPGRTISRSHVDALPEGGYMIIDVAVNYDNIWQPDNNKTTSPQRNAGLPAQTQACNMPTSQIGNPINISIGDKFQQEEDLHDNGSYPLNLVRYYNSLDGLWRHKYSAHIDEIGWPMSTIVFEDGREVRIYHEGDKEFKLSPTDLGKLIVSSGKSQYEYVSPFNEIYDFNSSGQLIKMTNNGGIVHNIKHVTRDEIIVSDTEGRSITILVRNDQQPLSATTSDGRHVSYEYDSESRLIKVIKNGKSKIYHYEDSRFPKSLTGITDENGIRYVTWTYDSKNRADSSTYFGGNNKYSVVYESELRTKYINPLNRTYIYDYKIIDGLKRITSITGNASSSCPFINTSYEYDNRGLVTLKTDGKGIKTSYSYNNSGQETSRTVGVGTAEAMTITTTWDSRFNKPKTETYPDKTITYEYDSDGNLIDQNIQSN